MYIEILKTCKSEFDILVFSYVCNYIPNNNGKIIWGYQKNRNL